MSESECVILEPENISIFDNDFSLTTCAVSCSKDEFVQDVQIQKGEFNFYKCKSKGKENHVSLRSTQNKLARDSEEELKELLHEVLILRKLKNTNIVEFNKIFRSNDCIYLVFEPVACFLSDIMELHSHLLHNQSMIKNVMRQLFQALAYIHEQWILHRDVNPMNIAFKENGELKLCNFRNACSSFKLHTEIYGTEYRYQSPEILFQCKAYGTATDIWSAICIFAQLLLMRPLFITNGRIATIQQIFSILGVPSSDILKFTDLPGLENMKIKNAHSCNWLRVHLKKNCPQFMNKKCENLLKWGLSYNPKYRPRAIDYLDDSYFTDEPTMCSMEELVPSLEKTSLRRRQEAIKRREEEEALKKEEQEFYQRWNKSK